VLTSFDFLECRLFRDSDVKGFRPETRDQRRQISKTSRVDGIVTTQYTQIFSDAFQPLSLSSKKEVLKNDYDCISQVMESGVTVYTVIKVAGRKVIVKIPSALITPLSFWAITLYAYIRQLLRLERALIIETEKAFSPVRLRLSVFQGWNLSVD